MMINLLTSNFLQNIIWTDNRRRNKKDQRIEEENIEELLRSRSRNDFSVKWLHIIIFLDDSAKSKLLKSDSYVSYLFSENRLPRLTFLLTINFGKVYFLLSNHHKFNLHIWNILEITS
ncbi:MAG: hypothetical protein Ta2E_01860 [Mycoplasmoidaceae bacterium]|nr:MAG: hypothetical protein Ta2E_01860 [Mycoplasmoidaceae bacterium]